MMCKDCIYLSVTFVEDDKEKFFCACDDKEVTPSDEACEEFTSEEP